MTQPSDPTQLTVGDLFTRLRPAQVWSIVLVIGAVVSGAFGLGFKLGAGGLEAKVATMQAKFDGDASATKGELEALRTRAKNSRALEDKEKFLALYLRYMLAQDFARGHTEDEAAKADVATTRAALEEVIHKGIAQREGDDGDSLKYRGLVIGKGGGPRDATVTFVYDNTTWPIPREFQVATKN